jgi:predicted homoserine dehydrogenase-like protein
MILVDTALRRRQQEGNPVRVGLVGAGYMGRGMALQINRYMPGLRVAGIANRTVTAAMQACQEAGIEGGELANDRTAVEESVAAGRCAVTDDPLLLCQATGIEVIIEATGHVEHSARVAMEAIGHRKHLVLMNAELDATVGPILKVYADRAGVVVSNVDGDQPGVMMNLYRFVDSIGYRPVLAGNIKGLQDYYRTPATQADFAFRHGLTPRMATAFADGTKMSMENALVANATGLKAGRRGMYGPCCAHANDTPKLFPMEQLLDGGLVDYILGAEPGPGVFVLGYNEHPQRQDYMRYFKMGEGPLYVFYTPYHLPHLEAPLTAARAVLFGDAAVTPLGATVCEVITVAKRDLRSGEELDGIGGFCCYGLLENSGVVQSENLLAMGLSEGCRVLRDIPRDHPLTRADVEVPAGRLIDQLWAEQEAWFASAPLCARKG